MTFLSPWYVPVLAALAAAPPLLLLYFLKLKRREVAISSTLLWRQAVEDLRVNSPFQRLRNSLLLWLQMAIVALAALALAEPAGTAVDANVDKTMVLLIDCSASMSSVEPDGRSRLDIAREQAIQLIDAMTADNRAMVIALADRSVVRAPFTSDKDALREAVRAIAPTDSPGTLAEAVRLAEAHVAVIEEEQGASTDAPRADFLLFTDGRLADVGDVTVRHGRLHVVAVGATDDNVGIVAIDARRHYERPEHVMVLGRVRNFSSADVETDVSLWVNGALESVQSLTLAPLADRDQLPGMETAGAPPEDNEAGVAFEFDAPAEADIELRLAREDALAADNRAFAIVPPPRALQVLLVTPGNRYLRDLVAAIPLGTFVVWTPAEYEQADESKLVEGGRSRYDVIILDGHSTGRLAPGNYMFFGAVPLIDGLTSRGLVNDGVILDWDETHPILRHVALDAVNVLAWLDIEASPPAVTIIEASNGPVLTLVRRPRHQHLICAFGFFDATREMLNTNWVFDESLVVFMLNSLRYLTGTTGQGTQQSLTVGEPITVPVPPRVARVTVQRPDGRRDEATVQSEGLASYAQTDRAGIYRVSAGGMDPQSVAINLLDERESFVAPYPRLHVAAGEVRVGTVAEVRPRPLWPFVLMAMAGLLLLEWFVYSRRMRV